MDTLGHLLAVHVTPANEQERDQVAVLAEAVQEVTGESVEIASVDQGYTRLARDYERLSETLSRCMRLIIMGKLAVRTLSWVRAPAHQPS